MRFLLFIFCLLAPLHSGLADRLYIDSTIAVVEDDVITNQQLREEIGRIRDELQAKGQRLPEERLLNRQVLELMINKSILLQEARGRGVSVTDSQVNTALLEIAQRNGLTLEQFRQALVRQGGDYNKFRENLREELTLQRIKLSYARNNAEVSDQEVDDFMKRNSALQQSLEYRLSHILIALPDGADSDQVSEAREQIESIRSRLLQGENFASLAAEFSDGGNAIQGGDLGWRRMTRVPSLFSGFVPTMKVGEVSDVVRSASGFHLVQLADRRDSERLIVRQARARHILIRPNEVTNSEQARARLEQLRQRIVEGEDFAELAREHSDDTGSGGLGGDLGWFTRGKMVDDFQEVVDATPVNQISPVFRTQFGWHVLEVLGRREVDETQENKRAKIREQLREQKQAEVLELWQQRLRDQAFVKIITDA